MDPASARHVHQLCAMTDAIWELRAELDRYQERLRRLARTSPRTSPPRDVHRSGRASAVPGARPHSTC
jgi:hypothetical protein